MTLLLLALPILPALWALIWLVARAEADARPVEGCGCPRTCYGRPGASVAVWEGVE